MANLQSTPLFCVETSDKISKKPFFINFCSSKSVIYPEVDYDVNRLMKEMSERGPVIEEFKIPLMSSPIFWTKEKDNLHESYVAEVAINDLFAIRRVITSDMMRSYLVEVAMLAIEEKYNSPNASIKTCGQFLGHKLDLCFRKYKVVESKQRIERSDEIVNNKITVVDESASDSSVIDHDDNSKNIDLFYRPASKILTCAVLTDRLPDSIGFSDDRIVMKLGDRTLVDTYLPFDIDLNEPMKYRFYEKFGAIRVVFKIL